MTRWVWIHGGSHRDPRLTTSGDSAALFKGALSGKTQSKQTIGEGPLPRNEMPMTILMMPMRSCVLTFTHFKICGMSTSSVSVDASLPVSSLVKSVVDVE